MEVSIPHVNAIRQSLHKVKSTLEATVKERPRLREYIERLEKEREELLQRLRKTNEAIEGIYEEQNSAKQIRGLNVRCGRVAGRISLWLESVNLTDDMSTLEQEVYRTKKKVDSLESQLDIENKQERLQSIFNRIGIQMTEWSNV